MANLVIVESPSKASTIKGYLGSNYKVVASIGHIRDLPKSSLGVDIENGFAAHYINIRGRGELIKELKADVKNADKVYLATDPDREGEAISWHLMTALAIPEKKAKRVTFNELTKTAVKDGIKHPRDIDMNIVNSQQARRILDRIVGYKLSPFFWRAVRSGLSAGRVQSVATKIIVERENEIRAFVPAEYWTVDAALSIGGSKPVNARFFGDKKGKIDLKNEKDAMAVVNAVQNAPFTVADIKEGTKLRAPAPPFTTSTMQQEASRKLNFQVQRTMKVAQELYEGVNLGSAHGGVQGLITYMRTDSLRISAEAQASAKSFILDKFGASYCPDVPRVYKTKANAQDAHEAIRPSNVTLEPAMLKGILTSDQYKLYKLIWDRYVASQMASAEINTVAVDFESAGYLFHTSGYTVKFRGFMAVYEESVEEKPKNGNTEMAPEKNAKLPPLKKNDVLNTVSIVPEQHFTEAPPRYNEGSLVKFFEERGIGRPSTYNTIISIIISRGYVKREGKSLVPTSLGEVTTELMEKNFPDIVNYEFTALMEDRLDTIENGDATVVDVLSQFYNGFARELEAAEKNVAEQKVEIPVEETDIICENCGSRMIVKNGRFGKFAACPNYPTCKNTKPLNAKKEQEEKKVEIADFKCELCGGDMVLRQGKFGSFYACSNYPKCKFTKPKVKSLGVACPKCGADLVTKWGKNKKVFYSCSKYPTCDFSSWDIPVAEKCPQCGDLLVKKRGKSVLCCHNTECNYTKAIDPADSNFEVEGDE
ncbi:MAG: type I DNA topoisomerase [Clostridia bacterium]|nr:type I DNA topoisomerase [Clostridia bacterium]